MIEHIAFEILIYTATICFICWLRYEPYASEEYPKPLPVQANAPKHLDLKAHKAMSIRQLKKLASKRKIKNYGAMTKNQLIQALAWQKIQRAYTSPAIASNAS